MYFAFLKGNEIDAHVKPYEDIQDKNKVNEINEDLKECMEEINRDVSKKRIPPLKGLADTVELQLEAARRRAELLLSDDNKKMSDSDKRYLDSKIGEAHLTEGGVTRAKDHYFPQDTSHITPDLEMPSYDDPE